MRQILKQQLRLLLGVAVLIWAFSSSYFIAQASHLCGLIITPEDSTDIIDCSNPFGATESPAKFTLKVGGVVLNEGGEATVPEVGTVEYFVEEAPNVYYFEENFYLHDGPDFKLVDTAYSVPTESDLRQFAEGFFAANVDSELYIQYWLGNTGGKNDPAWDLGLYYDFSDYVEQNFTPRRPLLIPGTYTLVLKEELLFMTKEEDNHSIWHQLVQFLIPKALAQVIPSPISTLTFTLLPEVTEPTGASSILFLPGIMGSRLYEKGNFCDGLSSEKELWFSLDECLQLRLTTQFTGQSVNPVFTKPGVEGILDEAIVFNIYKTFLGKLQKWKDDEIIDDFAAIPYDWRAELDKIIKSRLDETTGRINTDVTGTVVDGYLYKQLEELASSSKSGKVTIVAHSNGGLVAKQFLTALQNIGDPLLEKIDNLILVAVPQLGATNAVVGVLQGEDLDPVMPQSVSRRLMNTMPFSHHLMPVSGYFELVDIPVIAFESGTSTESWVNIYGNTISSRQELHDFLSIDSNRIKPALNDLATPEVVDNLLLDYARTIELVQNNFDSNSGIKIYQIAGTGLPTTASLIYFSDKECISRLLFLCTAYRDKLGYRVDMKVDGDDTVSVTSALALEVDSQTERRWIDLKSYNQDGFLGSNKNRKHKDIFEVEDIVNFISNTIQSTSTLTYEYLYETAPDIVEEERLVFQLHSPLDMSLVTSDGREVSSSTNEINGATYRRYGELQYISIPHTEDEAVLQLKGLATGSFTLDVDEVSNGEVTHRQTYSAIPSSTSTKATFTISGNIDIEESIIEIDYQGDGVVDVLYNTEGVVEEVVTYEDLFIAIKSLGLKKPVTQPLLNMAKVAEKFYERSLIQSKYRKLEEASLQVLKKQVSLYEKIRLIFGAQRQSVEVIINSLLSR